MSIALTYTGTSNHVDELTEIIQGCARNQRAAQEHLYRRFYPKMMGVVRRYIDKPEQAEEVINNGFLRAFQKIHTYGFKGSFEGWLRKIVFHAVSDYVKQHMKHDDKVVLVEKDSLIDNEIAAKLNYDQLISLVQGLPDATRAVFNMFVLEGLGHKEIGKLLGISEGTSKWHLSEGRRQLKEKIIQLKLNIN